MILFLVHREVLLIHLAFQLVVIEGGQKDFSRMSKRESLIKQSGFIITCSL
jgi:hypothetical protein